LHLAGWLPWGFVLRLFLGVGLACFGVEWLLEGECEGCFSSTGVLERGSGGGTGVIRIGGDGEGVVFLRGI